jgi:hypothetical protein
MEDKFEDEDDSANNEVAVGKLIATFPSVVWVSSQQNENGWWWVKFHLDMEAPASLIIVQALAYIFNGLSLNDPLPTRFFPTSSPPDMNGGPKDGLHWVVESIGDDVIPSDIYAALDDTLLFDVESVDDWLNWPAREEEK